MWILTQLFQIFLVLAGINILWAIIKAPFLWYSEWKYGVKRLGPVEGRRQQELAEAASREYYARRAQEMEEARVALDERMRVHREAIAAARKVG